MSKILPTFKPRKAALMALMSLAVFVSAMLLMAPHKAYASTLDDGTNIPTLVRDNVFYWCISQRIDVAQQTWISLAGQPSVTDVTINHRGDPVSLQLNVLVARCHSGVPTGIVITSFRWTSGSYALVDSAGNTVLGTTAIPTPSPANAPVSTPPTTGDGFSFASLSPFSVNTSTIVKPYVDVNLTVTSKQFNWFTPSNIFGCVVPPPPAPQNVTIPNILSDYLCPDAPATGTFRIFLANPPSPTVQDDCSGIDYQAGDSTSVEIDGPGGVLASGLPTSGTYNLPSSIAPGTNIDVYGYGPDGTSHTAHTWNPPNTNCPASITAIPGTTQLKPDAESPTSAVFSPSFSYTSPRSATTSSLTGVAITCHYYVLQGATQTALNPDTTSPPGGATLNPTYNCHDALSPVTDTRSIPSALNLKAGDEICESLSASVSTGSYNSSLGKGGLTVNPATGAVFSHGDPATLPSDYCVPVANEPYLSLYDGDITAGGVFDTGSTCTLSAISASIVANTNSSNNGSGTQLAAYASNTISKFNSASLRSVAPIKPTGLNFATPSGGFGVQCMHDYFSDQKSTATPDAATTVDLSTLSSGQYAFNHPITLSGTNPVPAGTNLVLFVTGDVTIVNNITYGYSGGGTTWSNPAQIPSVYIVAHGNINISGASSGGVTQLDGVYVAQPTGATGGTINTCTNVAVQWLTTDLYAQCANQLVVNGSFIAGGVNLQRSTGSLRDVTTAPVDSFGAGVKTCSNGSSSVGVCSGEVFNSDPESFITSQAGSSDTTTPNPPYQTINSLPPVL